MSTDPFDDILKRFDELSYDEQQALLEKLERSHATVSNGNGTGKTLLEAMNERGMLGSIKGAPSDWSSNPKYLEGLGKDDE